MLEVFLVIRYWQVVQLDGGGRGWCQPDLPINTADEAGNGIQVGAAGESAEQAREGLIAFTNDGNVDAGDRTNQLGAHFTVEVGAAKYRHNVRVCLFQAASKRERCGILLECRAESDNSCFFPGKIVDEHIQICWNIDVTCLEKPFPQLVR